MEAKKYHTTLVQLDQRLFRLEKLVIKMRDELKSRFDIKNRDIYLEMIEDTLLRLIRKWQSVIQQSSQDDTAAHIETGSKKFVELDFALGHIRGLGRDFDMDTSWFTEEITLRHLISDVSMTALSAWSILRGEEPPEISKKIYDDKY